MVDILGVEADSNNTAVQNINVCVCFVFADIGPIPKGDTCTSNQSTCSSRKWQALVGAQCGYAKWLPHGGHIIARDIAAGPLANHSSYFLTYNITY